MFTGIFSYSERKTIINLLSSSNIIFNSEQDKVLSYYRELVKMPKISESEENKIFKSNPV